MPADEKAIHVITFSGKHADWTVWEEKFLARSKNRGYTKILLGKEIPPKDDEEFDQNTPEGKEKSRLRKANDTAFTDLILSVDGTTASGRVAFNLVRLSKTKDHADGDAGQHIRTFGEVAIITDHKPIKSRSRKTMHVPRLRRRLSTWKLS